MPTVTTTTTTMLLLLLWLDLVWRQVIIVQMGLVISGVTLTQLVVHLVQISEWIVSLLTHLTHLVECREWTVCLLAQ